MKEAIRFDDVMVMVELVLDRPEKDDCRGHTPVMWHGLGDIQPYPKRLWPKLEPHTDVWRLIEDVTNRPSAADRALQEAKRLKADAQQAAGENRDVIVTLPTQLDEEALAAMSDDDVRAEAIKRNYGLHPRLNPVNLRVRFLEAQELEAQDLNALDSREG